MIETVQIAPLTPARFREVLTAEQADAFDAFVESGRAALAGRVIWNVNSTANGGGVAEMLRSLVAYARGGGVDARWVVVEGTPAFFRVTKRIHNRLHGSTGDGGGLGARERATYENVTAMNAAELSELVAPGDVVLLHDPQTAGLAWSLRERGAHVIWRCHVGHDAPNAVARRTWAFLLPYVLGAHAYVFSRDAHVWDGIPRDDAAIIAPSIDAFSPKNQDMSTATAGAILRAAGLTTANGRAAPVFRRHDGSPARVVRRAHTVEMERLPAGAPVVTQVSRWDRLKDPIGVMDAFAAHIAPQTDAHLVLAGPDVRAVADDPEGLAVLGECIARWETLGPAVRPRVHLAALPMDDAEENAAMVNALQRQSTVVVQKSLAEGFGLTVAEAMWKGTPVVASRIGGIQDQIADGRSGFLVAPRDLAGFGEAVVQLLRDPRLARSVGAAGQVRVRDSFLGPRHLAQYLDLFTRVMGTAGGHEVVGRLAAPTTATSSYS